MTAISLPRVGAWGGKQPPGCIAQRRCMECPDYCAARMRAIVSHLVAVEESAGMDVLCSDKTGTFTQAAQLEKDHRLNPRRRQPCITRNEEP